MLNEIKDKNEKLTEEFTSSKLEENTIKNYKSDIKLFSEFIDKDLLETTTGDASNYFKSINNKSTATKKRRISSLYDFFDYYIDEKVYVDEDKREKINPVKRIKRQKFPKATNKTQPLTLEETKLLINHIKKEIKNADSDYKKRLQIRNLAMIMLDLNAGFRIEEMLSLTFDDFDIEECKIELLADETKGKKDRTIFIDVKPMEYIKSYLSIRNDILKGKESEYVFVSDNGNKLITSSFDAMLKKYSREIFDDKGIELHLHSHRFRGTFITGAYESLKDIVAVQELVGHSSLLQTRSYIENRNKSDKPVKLATSRL